MRTCHLRGCPHLGNVCKSHCQYYIPFKDVPAQITKHDEFKLFMESYYNEHPELEKYRRDNKKLCGYCGEVMDSNEPFCSQCIKSII